MKKKIQLILLLLMSTSMLGLNIFEPMRVYVEYICVTFFLFCVLSERKLLWKTKPGKLLCSYFLFFTCSCIYSILIHGQSPITMYHGIINYVGLASYAFCVKNKFTFHEVRSVLNIIAIIVCSSYILQWVIYPTTIFGGAMEDSVKEDLYRVRIPMSLCAFYIFLKGIDNFLNIKYFKSIVFILLGGIPIIVMGFRSLTFMTLLASLLLYVSHSRLNGKTVLSAILLIGLGYFVLQTSLVNSKVEEMSQRQESEQTFLNEDYVRWIELYYYIDYYNKPGEWIIGGGVPCGTSSYSLEIQQHRDIGMYWEDLGIVGLSFIIGIITVCILVYWSLRMMSRCKNLEIGVECMTMFIALFGSIMTSMEYFRVGNFMILGLLFYCEYIYNREHGMPVDKFWLQKCDYKH